MSKHLHTTYTDFLNESADGLTAREKIKAAIGIIFIGSQFFGPILLRLWVIEDSSPRCKTMYTNGSVIAYSPKFVDTLKVSEVAWVLVHEIMHNILLHFSRIKPNAKMWNYATDYAINLLIANISDKFKMPKGGLYDEKYKGLSAEVIYNMLAKDQSQMPQNFQSPGDVIDEEVEFDPEDVVQHGQGGDDEDDEDGQGSGSGSGQGDEDGKEGEGSGSDGDEGDEDGKEGEGKDKVGKQDKKGKDGKGADDKKGKKPIVVKKATDTFIQSAVQAGLSKAPDAIRRYYESMFEAQIDWKKELKKYIKDCIDGIKYKLPYRRFAHTGTYLSGPIRKAEKLDSIVIIIDTSGSITDALLKTFMSEVAGVLAAYPVEKMYILSADDKVRTVNTLKNPRLLAGTKIDKPVDIKGGGGTDFEPAFQWIDKELKGAPNVVIYLTDLEGHFPSKPKYEKKVVWCTIIDHPIPFGKKINIKK